MEGWASLEEGGQGRVSVRLVEVERRGRESRNEISFAWFFLYFWIHSQSQQSPATFLRRVNRLQMFISYFSSSSSVSFPSLSSRMAPCACTVLEKLLLAIAPRVCTILKILLLLLLLPLLLLLLSDKAGCGCVHHLPQIAESRDRSQRPHAYHFFILGLR